MAKSRSITGKMSAKCVMETFSVSRRTLSNWARDGKLEQETVMGVAYFTVDSLKKQFGSLYDDYVKKAEDK